MKKSAKRILFFSALALLFSAYLAGGLIISYRRQPKVSDATKGGFDTAACYSSEESCDRACVIEDNEDALEERLRMIEQARERVILSTFEFRSDESGKDVLCALMAAAKRGVSVKVVSDGFPALINVNDSEYFNALAATDGVEVKIYNKLNPLAPWKSMGRLHDKYLIVDDDLYMLGGRNTYDFFLGEGDHGYKNYDRDVLVYATDKKSGERSLCQLESYFESIWGLRECAPLRARETKKTRDAKRELEERYEGIRAAIPDLSRREDYEKMTFPTNKITLLSNPTHPYPKEPTLFYCLAELMKRGEGEIYIHTPYVICNDWMLGELKKVCDRNPKTYMMTNSAANNGNPFGASDYLKNKEKLIDAGLSMLEYEGGVSYHGKSITIGERLAIVGSFNMDMRSAYLDTELMLVIDSEGVTSQLRRFMKDYEDEAVRVIDMKHEVVPPGVTRQVMDEDKEKAVRLLWHLNWLRFLF